jgi:hypothetical protein
MMSRIKRLVLEVLDSHRVMTVATNRPDGWPQATMVGYVNDGFLLYCWIARNAQKCANIRRDTRVSAAIGSDAPRPLDIKGLSLAGKAAFVLDQGEANHVLSLREMLSGICRLASADFAAGAGAAPGLQPVIRSRAAAYRPGDHLRPGLFERLWSQRSRHVFGKGSRRALTKHESSLAGK